MPESRRWRKIYRGRPHYLVLRPGETKESSYLRCLKEWEARRREIDGQSYDSLTRTLARTKDPVTGEILFTISARQLQELLSRQSSQKPRIGRAKKRKVYRPFFRYPGGKAKLRQTILSRLVKASRYRDVQYREPFFGGGSIGVQLLIENPEIKRIWINDRDFGIACLWTSIIRYPAQLKELILDFRPSVESFHNFRTQLLKMSNSPKGREAIVKTGFRKLAIHQTSYSGLGTMSGGPLGGETQLSRYKINCRWSPESICKQIDALHRQLSEIEIKRNECTAFDFINLVEDESQPALLYLDPPYFVKGNGLYQYGLTVRDHERLARALRRTKHQWLLSYDDCPEIRELYGWAVIEPVVVTYGLTGKLHRESGERQARTKAELLISPSRG